MAKFSQEVINLAQQTETKYGVPASVTLAQYAVESGYGTSGLATKANNYFGVTGKNQSTGKYVMMNGRSWASYGSMAESFDDHGRLLSTPLYANSHKNTTNAYQYVDAIAETYAPSSDGNNGYAALVKQVISDNNLTQYDKAGVSASGSGTILKPSQGGLTFQEYQALYGSSSSGGSVTMTNIMGTGATATVTQEQYQEMVSNNVFSSDYWLEILGKIVKFLALVIVGVMAAVFFFNAFDFDAKKIVSKAITKKVKKEGGKDGGE